MVLGIDLVIRAGLVDGNEFHIEDVAGINSYCCPNFQEACLEAFLELWSKTYPIFS